MGWACSFAGEKKMHTEFKWVNLNEGGHMDHPGMDERKIVKQILKK